MSGGSRLLHSTVTIPLTKLYVNAILGLNVYPYQNQYYLSILILIQSWV